MLSSDWRRCPLARDECARVLARHRLALLDRTPEHGSPYTEHRATEILAWVEDHNAHARTVRAAQVDQQTNRHSSSAFPNAADTVTHFVAVDHRALVSELCGELLVGRHVMTHPREGLTRAAVEAVVASLSSEQAALPERLLHPATRSAVTNKNVGSPVPWATYWEEEAFPPAPKPSQGSSVDDTPMFGDDEVVMTECLTPRGNDANVATSPSPGNNLLTFAPSTPAQSWDGGSIGSVSAASSDGESRPGTRCGRRPMSVSVSRTTSSTQLCGIHSCAVVGVSVGAAPGTPLRRRPETAASSQRGGGSRGGIERGVESSAVRGASAWPPQLPW